MVSQPWLNTVDVDESPLKDDTIVWPDNSNSGVKNGGGTPVEYRNVKGTNSNMVSSQYSMFALPQQEKEVDEQSNITVGFVGRGSFTQRSDPFFKKKSIPKIYLNKLAGFDN